MLSSWILNTFCRIFSLSRFLSVKQACLWFFVLNGILLHSALPAEEISVGECKMTYRNRAIFSIDHPGLVASIPEEGTMVQQGDLLVQLQDEIPRANLAVAIARIGSTASQIMVEQKNVESATVEYESAIEANRVSRGGIAAYPATHIARLKINREVAEFKLEVAKADHQVHLRMRDQAEAELQSYRIVSGFSGMVVQAFKHKGESVQQGESLVELVNISQLRVEGYVSLQESTRIKPGHPAVIHLENFAANMAGPLPTLKTTLGFVDVSVQTLSNRVRVWADIDNTAQQLREGLPVRMHIEIEKHP